MRTGGNLVFLLYIFITYVYFCNIVFIDDEIQLVWSEFSSLFHDVSSEWEFNERNILLFNWEFANSCTLGESSPLIKYWARVHWLLHQWSYNGWEVTLLRSGWKFTGYYAVVEISPVITPRVRIHQRLHSVWEFGQTVVVVISFIFFWWIIRGKEEIF